MSIKKAVIPSAGLGKRLYPLTRTIPKIMLPVGSKPMIQYAVEEAASSGIEEICIVVGRNSQTVVDYLTGNSLHVADKAMATDLPLEHLLKTCEITFVEQPEPLGIADAVSRARGFVGTASFAIIVPDTLFFSDRPGLKQVIDVFKMYQSDCSALVEMSQIDELQTLGNYGFVDYEKLDENVVKITKLYGKGEMPDSSAPLRKRFLKTFGRSVNRPEFFEFIEQIRGDLPLGTELDDVPVIRMLIQRVGRLGCVLRGEAFDVGSLQGYQYACHCLTDPNVASSTLLVGNRKSVTYARAVGEERASNDVSAATPILRKQEKVLELRNRSTEVKFSVVIPLLNEKQNLGPLHSRLTKVMESLGEPYEIIFVDDGSKDGSFEVLKGLFGADSHVKVIRLTRNFGQVAAKSAGFDFARGAIVVTMDADLEQPPEEIPKLIEKLNEGYEVIYGIFRERRHSFYRRAGSDFSKWILSKIVPVSSTSISGFAAIRANAIERLNLCGERTRFLAGLLSWTGADVGTVRVEHHRRHAGKSAYNPFKLLALWFDMIVSFTDLPLRVASIAGLALGAGGGLLALAYFIRYLLYGFGVPGFATIIIVILVFFGAQFLYLGLVGEYLARMNTEVRNRPRYLVRSTMGISEADNEVNGH